MIPCLGWTTVSWGGGLYKYLPIESSRVEILRYLCSASVLCSLEENSLGEFSGSWLCQFLARSTAMDTADTEAQWRQCSVNSDCCPEGGLPRGGEPWRCGGEGGLYLRSLSLPWVKGHLCASKVHNHVSGEDLLVSPGGAASEMLSLFWASSSPTYDLGGPNKFYISLSDSLPFWKFPSVLWHCFSPIIKMHGYYHILERLF